MNNIDQIPILKHGGIHIKPENRGKFSDYCGGKVTEECIRKGKNSPNPLTRKRAAFAGASRTWKHENGSIIRFQPGGTVKLDDYGYPADITPAVVTQDPEFNKFLMTLPDNLRLTPEKDYYLYKSWKMNGRPRNFQEGLEANMYNWDDSDNSYHGVTVIGYDENGVGIFGKPKHHDTVRYELDWYNKGIGTLEGGEQYPLQGEERKEWEDFRSQYQLDSTGVDYKYVPIKKNGGILKAQEGTPKYGLSGGVPTYVQSKPFSPIDIAIKTAQARTSPTPLPPGVKEVVGPDGKTIVIRTEQPLMPLEQSIAEWLPGTGDVAEVGYIADDVKNGNYGSAALAAGLVVVPGGIGTAVHKARQLPPLDKIRDNRLRELVEYVQNFGVEKLPFETYLELDDALRYADIGLKGNRKRVQNIVKRVTDDIEKYYDDFRAARANTRSTKPTPIKDDWKEPFDEMRPMKSFGHRAKTTHKRGGMLQALDYANHITKKPAY